MRDEQRMAREQRLLSGADCVWTQLQKSQHWYCRANGRTYRLSPTKDKMWQLYRVNLCPMTKRVRCSASTERAVMQVKWLRNWRTSLSLNERTKCCLGNVEKRKSRRNSSGCKRGPALRLVQSTANVGQSQWTSLSESRRKD
jgi:hypothetical protein